MKQPALRILLVEDNPADAELIRHELRRAKVHHEGRCVDSKSGFLAELHARLPDAIISDFSMPQFNALDALQVLKEQNAAIPFILVTGSQSEEVAVECIKKGADDYLLKSSLTRLPTALLGSIQKRRAQAENQLAERQIHEQAALLNKARDAIMVVDLAGTLTFWNDGAEKLYGWTRDEALGKATISDLLKLESARFDEACQTALQHDEWHGELRQCKRDDREVFVESRWSLVRDASGQPKSILIINSDITEKRKLEAHFLRSQRLESIGTLAGGIAHDLNNVLTPILVSIKLLREMKGNTPDEVLETLETSAHRGASIVQQVLSFARGVEGEKTILQVKHPLSDVLKIAKDVFPRTVEIRSYFSPDLWAVYGDPTQLYQVFMNLIVNARDAMPNGGRLQLEAKNTHIDENYARMQPDARPGRYVLVNVSDTGTGIPTELVGKIFEPFFTTKETGKGTGLGLSTAIGIVRNHGGFLTVYSEYGKGSSFKVYLPAAETFEAHHSSDATSTLHQGGGELIMVVDDEAAIREIIKLTLENNGYKVITANDGPESVALLASEKRKVRAAMVDLMMPYLDGIATIRALQKLNPALKYIAISGLMDNARTGQLAELGDVSYLAKPFTTEQILDALKTVLKPSKA